MYDFCEVNIFYLNIIIGSCLINSFSTTKLKYFNCIGSYGIKWERYRLIILWSYKN